MAARSASGRHGFPWRAAGLLLVVLVILTGAGLIGLAAKAPDPVRPPQPDLAAAPPFQLPPSPDEATAPEPTRSKAGASPSVGGIAAQARGARDRPADKRAPAATSPSPSPQVHGMPRSEPTRIRIPRIGVDASTTALGLDKNQQIAVPPAKLTGWYKLGPSPGEAGTAVVVGHVDARGTGPAVFFRLGALKPGDTIEVLRKDGKTARFVVDGVARYPKKNFPSKLVYGHTGKAQLRLITCGGGYDKAAKSYKDNIVAFASLTSAPR
ncbi:class F sortase [Micromonospora sp. WMMD812]|uniref:class F sortase n=1 Tax=Micromonospora sp. WMMD812 TaxID=3015152 RepID=UPI00248C30D9|nr:class F sortase [Micromonospora sp. WMMD812]WBB66668.1 class F sortase [Micromonospora sp. WMMD812]